ncbi:hypothetical protein [Prochlorococcus sp. MIT 1307]|uniref:hypothetical protein n=1 Tax=Prochlorococcus sp. MIT 1307 TaxID=3096219 RepID=UPI002A748680|nr:hypothetical protein [Prochlorococcus sp. MIT 1307]
MKNSKSNKKLPWWVELLFVQIGLPDSWLRTFLKSKRKGKYFIHKQKKPIIYALMTSISLIYFYPIVKQASLHNNCVDSAIVFVKNSLDKDTKLNMKQLEALSTSFCNGGDI